MSTEQVYAGSNPAKGAWRKQMNLPHLVELEQVVSLFNDDDKYLKECIELGTKADLPLSQVLASIECRAQKCLHLLKVLQYEAKGLTRPMKLS